MFAASSISKPTTAVVSLPAGQPMANYGVDNPVLSDLLHRIANDVPSLEVIEAFNEKPDVINTLSATHQVTRRTYSDFDSISTLLCKQVPKEQTLRIITVHKLSGPVLQLLGSKYEMDYELWTNRFHSSDREWFAGPFLHRGAREFSHFNLSCVEFCRATATTPENYLANQKIGHTVRLMRFLDPPQNDLSCVHPPPRLFVIRRIAGHLRHDENLWTFIFFTDPYIDISAANYVQDIPRNVLSPSSMWLSEYVKDDSPPELIDDLGRDGFGLVLKVLRDIKTSWKLLLDEMEVFMESLAEEYSDDELVDSAIWLHRRFIMNLDYCSRQLLYHQRFLTYLTNAPLQKRLCIAPTVYKHDLLQEKDAVVVAVQRLQAIRDRTTSILKTVLNLHAAHQARLAGETAALQRQDAAITVRQNDAIWRLTFVNMAYLPPSFMAGVYGMNVAQNGTTPNFWSLWSFIGVAIALTIVTLVLAHAFSGLPAELCTVARIGTIPEVGSNLTVPQSIGVPSMYQKVRSFLGFTKEKVVAGDDLV